MSEFAVKICVTMISLNIFLNTIIDFINNQKSTLIIFKLLFCLLISFFTFFFFFFLGYYICLLFLITFEIVSFNSDFLYKDTSDKIQFQILIGLTVVFFSISLALCYITSIIMLTYFFTGINKMKSKSWRNGDAIFQVINTESFGNEKLSELIYHKTNKQKIISWSLILFQFTFPICVLNSKICIIYLIIGFVFHFFNMIILKLHNFFWVFISTYPCIYIMSLKIESFLEVLLFN